MEHCSDNGPEVEMKAGLLRWSQLDVMGFDTLAAYVALEGHPEQGTTCDPLGFGHRCPAHLVAARAILALTARFMVPDC